MTKNTNAITTTLDTSFRVLSRGDRAAVHAPASSHPGPHQHSPPPRTASPGPLPARRRHGVRSGGRMGPFDPSVEPRSKEQVDVFCCCGGPRILSDEKMGWMRAGAVRQDGRVLDAKVQAVQERPSKNERRSHIHVLPVQQAADVREALHEPSQHSAFGLVDGLVEMADEADEVNPVVDEWCLDCHSYGMQNEGDILAATHWQWDVSLNCVAVQAENQLEQRKPSAQASARARANHWCHRCHRPIYAEEEKVHKATRQAEASVSPETVIGHIRHFVQDLGSAQMLMLPPTMWHVRSSVLLGAHTFSPKSQSEGENMMHFTRLIEMTLSDSWVDEWNVTWILVKPPPLPHGSGGAKEREGRVRPLRKIWSTGKCSWIRA
ncbi:hypothetical protein EDB87DRAFT_1824561 [Lactarius vividus]|nr:hypothetical protein EDB87DRAFT_1824561 [Lactarius vividus]